MTDYPQLPCPTFAQLLRDAREGKLERGAMGAHIDQCPVCQEWHNREMPKLEKPR